MSKYNSESVYFLHDDSTINYQLDMLSKKLKKSQRIQYAMLTIIVVCIALLSITIVGIVYKLESITNYIGFNDHYLHGMSTSTDIALNQDTSSGISVRDTGEVGHLQKRFFWTLGVAVFRTAGLGFAILGVDSACKSYDKTGSSISGLLCVTGALTTAVEIGGRLKAALAALNVAKTGIAQLQIALSGIQTGFVKRDDENIKMLEDLNANLTHAFGTPYKLHGFMHKNNTKHGFMIPHDHPYDSWPVYEITNHHGHRMHHMITPISNGQYMNRLAYAYANSTTYKRDVYDNEYFSSGGLDFTACDNGGNPDQFNTGDFGYLEPTVQCEVSDQDSVSTLEYELYDTTRGTDMGSGSIAGVGPNGKTEINSDPQCPTNLPPSSCPAHGSTGQ